jgi:hypothetical protein
LYQVVKEVGGMFLPRKPARRYTTQPLTFRATALLAGVTSLPDFVVQP